MSEPHNRVWKRNIVRVPAETEVNPFATAFRTSDNDIYIRNKSTNGD